jgi:superoxide reductase
MKVYEIYSCACEGEDKCDGLIEVLNGCEEGPPSCCGVPMKLVEEKTADQGKEKHVPVIIPVEGGYEVRVGEVPHPMLEKHFITMIELFTPDAMYRKFLKPDEEPAAFFPTKEDAIGARAYCNIHGLWRA